MDNNIYDEKELTILRALQYILLGAVIPIIFIAPVMDIFVSMFSFMSYVLPYGFWFTGFISIVFLSIMIVILKYGVHKLYLYFSIQGKGKMIADISYIGICVAYLFSFQFPQP